MLNIDIFLKGTGTQFGGNGKNTIITFSTVRKSLLVKKLTSMSNAEKSVIFKLVVFSGKNELDYTENYITFI